MRATARRCTCIRSRRAGRRDYQRYKAAETGWTRAQCYTEIVPTRRELLIGSTGGLLCAACGGGGRRGAPKVAAACEVTAADAQGPYYLPGAPRRAALASPGSAGKLLVLSGVVRGIGCGAIAGAELDVWQANQFGHYDLSGVALRGRILTDDAGRYAITTIVPGRYRSEDRVRPAHIHFKISAPGHRVLTTQVYFRGDPYAAGDRLYQAERATDLVDDGHGSVRAEFDFVIDAL